MIPETRKEERREKRAEKREKREKRAPQRRKVLDPRNCLRFQGSGGGHPNPPKRPRTVITAWVFEGLASKSGVSLRFRLDSRFL